MTPQFTNACRGSASRPRRLVRPRTSRRPAALHMVEVRVHKARTAVTQDATVYEGMSAMTASVVHQCPRCELRFSFRTEMEQHLRDDHPRPVSEERKVEAAIVPPPPPPVVAPAVDPVRSASTRTRLAVFVLAVIGVFVVVYAAVYVTVWAAALIAAAVLLLTVICVRRARTRPRPSRR